MHSFLLYYLFQLCHRYFWEYLAYKHLEFLEGFDESVSFSTLENQKWSKKIKNVQSMVDGYWLRFSTVNNLTTNIIGLSHNYNKEKKLFVKNSLKDQKFVL